MKRAWKILLRVIAAIAVLLVVALAAAYGFTFTDRFRDLARTQLLTYLNEAFRGEVVVERIEGTIWGDLALDGLSVRYGGKEILRAPRVVLRYALLPVLRGRVDVSEVSAAAPRLVLEQDEQGSWNLLGALSPKVAAPPSEGGSGLAITLDSVMLRDAEIEITPFGSPSYFLSQASLEAGIEVLASETNAEVRTLAFRMAREGLPIVRTEAALDYRGAAPGRVLVRALAIATERSDVRLTGEVKNLAEWRNAAVSADLTIAKLAPGDITVFVPEWTAADDLRGRVSVSGTAADLHSALELAIADARLDAEIRADVAAEAPRYDGTVRAKAIDLGKLAGGFGVAGIIDAEVRAKGAGAALAGADGAAKVEVRGLAASGWQLGDVKANGTIATERAKLGATVTIDGVKRAALDGEADLGASERYRLAASLERFNPKRLAQDRVPLGGDLNLRATLEGQGFTLATTQGRAQLKLSPSRLGDVQLDRGAADVRLGGGRAKVALASLASRDAKLALHGDLGLRPEDPGRLDYDLAVGDLAPWMALAGTEGSGALELHGALRGAIGDLATEGRLKGRGLRVGESTVGEVAAEFSARNLGGAAPQGRASTKVAGVRAGIALRQATAEVALAPSQRFTAKIAAIDEAGRSHDLGAEGSLGPSAVKLRLVNLKLESPQGPWRLVHPADVLAKDRRITIEDFAFASEAGKVTIAGSVAPSGPQRLRLEMQGFTLETVKPLLAGMPELAGTVSARIDVTGTAAAPRITGETSVAALRIAGQPYEGLSASLRYEVRAATLDATFKQDASHALHAGGTIPVDLRWDPGFELASAGDMNLSVRSSGLSLAFLNAIAGPSVRSIGGEVSMDLSITGPITEPRPRGTVELRGGGATIAALGAQIHEGSVAVAFDPQVVRVERLFARSGDGTLEGEGTIPVVAGAADPLRLSFKANRFTAASTNRMRAIIGGEVSVAGTTAAPDVRGRVELFDATIRPDLAFLGKAPPEPDSTIEVVSIGAPKEASSTPPAKPPSIYANASIDVTAVVHRNTWVRQADASVELEGEVRATKKPNETLTLVGEIQTVRGWARLQGKRFTVARGRVVFTGGEVIDPMLDVVADHRRGEYIVHAIVSGTANSTALTLDSEPSLEQADILSVLLFGKPASELNDGEQKSMQKQAAEIAGSYAFSEVGNAVAQALGLEGSGIQVEEISSERIALGAYITEKTYVRVGQDIGNRAGQEVAIEYRILKNVSVETSTNTAGGSGADVVWRRRY